MRSSPSARSLLSLLPPSFALLAALPLGAAAVSACTVEAPEVPSFSLDAGLPDGAARAGDGGGGGDGAPDDEAASAGRARCAQLVGCVAKHAPATLAPITQAYGVSGTCWNELGDEACVAACGAALGQLRVTDDASCTYCASQDDCSESLSAGACDLATNRCVPCTDAPNRDACEGLRCDPDKEQAACGAAMVCSTRTRECVEDKQGLACSDSSACGVDYACSSGPTGGPRQCLRYGCEAPDGRPIPGFCTGGSVCLQGYCATR